MLVLVPDSCSQAQGTKVVTMRARVVIAPGATVQERANFEIDIIKRNSVKGQVSFNTSRYAQTSLEVTKSVALDNEHGDSFIMKVEKSLRTEGYEQYIDLTPEFLEIPEDDKRGNYTGVLPITIFYN